MAVPPTNPSGYLPLQLSYGLILIYNVLPNSSINHIKAPPNFNWGTIYQISPYGIPDYRSVGQSGLFEGKNIICTLAVSHHNYPMIEVAKLVTIELGSPFEPEP